MPRSAVWLLAAAVASLPYGAITSPIVGTQGQKLVAHTDSSSVRNLQPTRKLSGKFLHITDFHPDEFYKTHTSTEEGIACHRGKGPAGTYGAETTDCDSPFSLVNSTLEWVAKNIKHDIDFVVWTGDTARHDSDEKLPRDSSHVLGTNRQVADLMVETFSDNGRLSIPIIPTFGNNDFLPHNIFFPGPNRWLQYYNDIWRRFIPEEQRHSFEFGGWFEVEVIPNKLSVFSLNTMYFFDRNAGVDGCAQPHEPGFKHMEWLSVQLQRLRERGMKAILVGHVPPARTDSKQLWDETCWQKYTLWLKQYRDVVTGSLYGHMNIDHFLLQDTKEIDLSYWGQDYEENSIDRDYSIQSKGDYLVELRESWTNLPQMVARSLEDESRELEMKDDADHLGKGKKKKGKRNKNLKKIGGKYGERYHLSLVSPSVVPNYLPSLRVFEYNITGLEDSKAWSDSYDISLERPKDEPEPWEKDLRDGEDRELKRDLEAVRKHHKKKGKKGRKGGKKPKYPDLVIPDGPPKGSTPGPAYSNQPFTFLGYTQYYANLTHINNDMTGAIHESKWRDGDFSDRDPKSKEPKPRKFKYQVEYSTFKDKLYKLPDLTVRSYLKLAYRIAKTEKKKKKGKGKNEAIEKVDDDVEDDYDLNVVDASSREVEDESVEEEDLEDSEASESESDADDDEDEDEDDEDYKTERTRVGDKSKKRKERKQKNKLHKINKVWIHFLDHAFVSTVPRKALKKL